MIESSISIQSGDVLLSGTLCLPALEGPFPTFLMIQGSGPLDRNENTKKQKLNIFNSIAHVFAEAGIASVRYDKRGCYESSGDYNAASQNDLADDAARWVDAIHERDFCRANMIYLLGHSEETIIAAQVQHKRKSDIAGLVLLCPLVTAMEETLLKQASQLDKEYGAIRGWYGLYHKIMRSFRGSFVSQQQTLIRSIKASTSDTRPLLTRKIPVNWFRGMFALDLPSVYRRTTCVVLIIGGEKDLQCDPTDVKTIASLCGGVVESTILADLTHVLRFDTQEPAITRMNELIKKPVEKMVIEIIIDWTRRVDVR